MINISHKIFTLRKAIAEAVISVSDINTIKAIRENTVPKGNIFEMSKAAGLLAIKKTSDMIPDCHPMPVEFASISHSIEEMHINILVEVHTIYKTGVEVEAMHGASVVALTIYDMLKPIDKGITIEKIKLVEKKGGKSDYEKPIDGLNASIMIVNNSIASNTKENKLSPLITQKLKQSNVEVQQELVIHDNAEEIKDILLKLCGTVDLLIISGGTGLTKNDITPQTIKPMLEFEIDGIMQYARNYGSDRTPFAMLSRSFAGVLNKTLVISIPGSTRGAQETMDALFPHVLHAFKMLKPNHIQKNNLH